MSERNALRVDDFPPLTGKTPGGLRLRKIPIACLRRPTAEATMYNTCFCYAGEEWDCDGRSSPRGLEHIMRDLCDVKCERGSGDGSRR